MRTMRFFATGQVLLATYSLISLDASAMPLELLQIESMQETAAEIEDTMAMMQMENKKKADAEEKKAAGAAVKKPAAKAGKKPAAKAGNKPAAKAG